jgi:hypothetical protein
LNGNEGNKVRVGVAARHLAPDLTFHIDGNASTTLHITPGGHAELIAGGRVRGETVMLFKQRKSVVCSVCGRLIASTDRRFVDKNRVTKEERHTHIDCRAAGPQPRP